MKPAPHYSMRERAAIRLAAAFQDLPARDLPGMLASTMPGDKLAAWLRVLDVATGVRDLREGQPSPDQFQRETAKIKPPSKALWSVEPQPPPPPNAMVWCEQCDRRVTNAEAKSCRSLYCKVPVK